MFVDNLKVIIKREHIQLGDDNISLIRLVLGRNPAQIFQIIILSLHILTEYRLPFFRVFLTECPHQYVADAPLRLL